MTYNITYSRRAAKDLKRMQESGLNEELAKVKDLAEELTQHPESGEGKVEELREGMHGEYSRRINHENRMVYTIDHATHTVTLLQLLGHYGDH